MRLGRPTGMPTVARLGQQQPSPGASMERCIAIIIVPCSTKVRFVWHSTPACTQFGPAVAKLANSQLRPNARVRLGDCPEA